MIEAGFYWARFKDRLVPLDPEWEVVRVDADQTLWRFGYYDSMPIDSFNVELVRIEPPHGR